MNEQVSEKYFPMIKWFVSMIKGCWFEKQTCTHLSYKNYIAGVFINFKMMLKNFKTKYLTSWMKGNKIRNINELNAAQNYDNCDWNYLVRLFIKSKNKHKYSKAVVNHRFS